MKDNINRLTLGTVQFGLDYGINNPSGKPSREKSLSMLNYAWQKGIRIFDTAYAYGDAQEILGEFISTHNLGSEIKIITKLKPNVLSESSGSKEKIIRKNIKESLRLLKMDCVDGFLLHTPGYIRDPEILLAMEKMKNDGLTRNIGVSIYEVDDAIYAAKQPVVDYIQVPYSILDQRLDNKTFRNLTEKNNIKVFARSAFLQGLFFMPEEKIPPSFPNLDEVKAHLKQIDEIIQKYGLTRQQAALLFSYCNKNIDHVVFGVDNIGQLKEDIQIIEKHPSCDECINELKNEFKNTGKDVIFQSLWKK